MHTVADREYSLAPCAQYQEEEVTIYPQGRMTAVCGNKMIDQRMGGRVDGNQGLRCLLLFTGDMTNLAEWFCGLAGISRSQGVVSWARRVVCQGHLLLCNRWKDVQ